MTPKESRYTFITIPSPLVLPDSPGRPRSGTSPLFPTAAHNISRSAALGPSGQQRRHDTSIASTAVAAGEEPPGTSVSAPSTSPSADAAVLSSSVAHESRTVTSQRSSGGAAALRFGAESHSNIAATVSSFEPLTVENKNLPMSGKPLERYVQTERPRACSEEESVNLSPLGRRSDSRGLERQQQCAGKRPTRGGVCVLDNDATTGNSCSSSSGNGLPRAAQSSSMHEGKCHSGLFSTSSSTSTVLPHHQSRFYLPQPALAASISASTFSSSSLSPSSSSSSSLSSWWRIADTTYHSNVRRLDAVSGPAFAASAIAEPPYSSPQQLGSNATDSNSTSSEILLPSFADAPLPPLAVEDAAMMLREFAALLQRLEHTGQQLLQQKQKQPPNMRMREDDGRKHHQRHFFSPPEQLQQQAIICASLSARLERLFEANDAYSAPHRNSPGSPKTRPEGVVEADVLEKKKIKRQLMLPGVRSRAGIPDVGGRGEEEFQGDSSNHRVGLRTLGTVSTLGSNGSVSFEFGQAHSPPRTSLEIYRGRLRLAKLKEDFQRLQQKHERLVTLFNIRMLLPLSRGRRKISRGDGIGADCSDTASPPTQIVARSSSRDKQQNSLASAGSPTTPCVPSSSSSRSENNALSAPEAREAAVSRCEGPPTAQSSGFLSSLDFLHFAAEYGGGRDESHVEANFPRTRRRHSSTLVSCGRPSRFPSGGAGGAYTPLRCFLRYQSTGSSCSSGGAVGSSHQQGLPQSSMESGFGTFYSFKDPGSVSFGDSLPPIHLFSRHEQEREKAEGVFACTDGLVSQRRLSAANRPHQRGEEWEANSSRRKSNASTGIRWRCKDSPLLFPGEASLENVWKPARLQEVDEGFEEQQRREQLQQLQHIEDCVNVLRELHVQMADEVDATEEPLAAVVAETKGAAEQTAQANQELVTASLRRSRWWGVQGGGVAAAAGVVVGGLAGGPVGAAVGLICGAFIGATSGSALEREHRHKLLRFTKNRTRRRRPLLRQDERQLRSASVPVLDDGQRQAEYRREQELVSRRSQPNIGDAGEGETNVGGSKGVNHERATRELERPPPKSSTQQHVRATKTQHPATATSGHGTAVTAACDRRGGKEQHLKRSFWLHQPSRLVQGDLVSRRSNGASRSSSNTALHSTGSSYSSSTVDCFNSSDTGHRGRHKAGCTTDVCTSREKTADANAPGRRGAGQGHRRNAAPRKSDKMRFLNVPLPALLGWGGSSVLQQQNGTL